MMFDREAVRRQLAGGSGVLEWIARDHKIPTIEVLKLLPEEDRIILSSPPVGEILAELSGWGEVMIIVQTPSIVAEIVSALPHATVGRGYYNFHDQTPFGGHLKEDACHHIACVERLFGERRSLSVVFYDQAGESIFKIFVRRDEHRALLAEQVKHFDALKARFKQLQG